MPGSTELNLNGTNPAAPGGSQNVQWQVSAPYPDPNNPEAPLRDASAYVPIPPNFADAETPGGSGTALTLAHAPNPASSLQLFRNGLLQSAGGGNDFTLSGSNITLSSTAGTDVFLAWYRY